MIDKLSYTVIPIIMAIVGLFMLFSKKPVYDSFIEGARQGLVSAVDLLPTLILLMSAVSMFSVSGGAEWLSSVIGPFAEKVGIPGEIITLLIVRPLSGSASNALAADLFAKYGPDSFPGRCASVIMGSSDTLLYVTAVYLSAARVKKSRHTVPVAFAVMIFCIIISCFTVSVFFR